jgi:hypothetical protein
MQLPRAPISTGKYKPASAAACCAACIVTPAPAVSVCAATSSSSIPFIRSKDRTTSLVSVQQPCTRFVVPPNGTTA